MHELLTDPTIDQEGLNFLDRVFRHQQTQEAGLALLTQVLKDDRFMNEAQIFGTDLIAWVIARDQIQQDFKGLVIKTLDDEEVKQETINVLEYITEQKQSEEMLARYLNTVFLRDDILKNLKIILTMSVQHTMSDETTKNMFQDFMLQVAMNQDIKEGIFENYLMSPLRSFFTFGY